MKEPEIIIEINMMKELEKTNSDLPLLVHTDLEVVDEKLNVLNKSFWKYRKWKKYLLRILCYVSYSEWWKCIWQRL